MNRLMARHLTLATARWFLAAFLVASLPAFLPACSPSSGSSNPTTDASCSTGGTECPNTGDTGGSGSGVTEGDASLTPMADGGTNGGGSSGSSGTNAGSTGDASASTGGNDGGVDAGPCPGCPSGLCLESGVCIECASDSPCLNPALKCELSSGTCVECLPSADDCVAGEYCSSSFECVAGCKPGDACGGGVCGANHQCVDCSADKACANTALKCELTSGSCVECLPSADDCIDGEYCDESFSCSPGCKSTDACGGGICNASHVCEECSAERACANSALKCNLTTKTCEECLTTADECPDGKYCDASQTCIAGCKNPASCGSGVCNASHECENCLDDLECGEGRVCGTFECGATCGGVDDPACALGTECCGDECVDTERDIAHCGGCSQGCEGTEFCGSSGCTDAVMANFCKNYKGAVVLDGQSGDDAESAILLPELENGCSPAPAMRFVSQDTPGVLNPWTGQPVAGGNDVLVTIGSAYSNRLVRYLETNRIAPVYQVYIPEPVETFEFRRSGTDALLVTTAVATETDTEGYFLIEAVRDPASGTLVVVAYGYWAGGTAAAAWFLANVMLPDLSNFTDTWYIYRWENANVDLRPDAGDTFTPINSGN